MNGARRRFRSTQAGRSNFAAQQKMPGAHWLQALPGGIPGAIRTRDLPLRSRPDTMKPSATQCKKILGNTRFFTVSNPIWYQAS